ncbi:TIGR02677 family protein [Halomonas sp. SSL-5]|uniref:TIGR02677 family protein n=1 Tax=Halomonas sp. SSL-5 TaxID=3065855 RepID=UPI002739409E|nr:TIGR02677 family protein [Halomonas sp. SSL-5]MDY7117516.1 TIGR02677 family protein [Halomonas sp. SSL-5]
MDYTPFSYVTAEKAELYRRVMRAFVEAKSHFLVHLRPEDVQQQTGEPELVTVQAALTQLVAWGNLDAERDNARVTSVEDYYRALYVYQITRQGEAVEAALATFEQELGRRGALQSVALEDIRTRLRALLTLAQSESPSATESQLLLRDLAGVFADLAENARAFMTGLNRTLEGQGSDADAFLLYKERVIGYIERFLGDLTTASGEIAELIRALDGDGDAEAPVARLLRQAAERELLDLAPGESPDDDERARAFAEAWRRWHGHWEGLRAWFLDQPGRQAQARLLRSSARRAVTQLLEMVGRLNERRMARSDRSADFRTLARWFLECDGDGDAHRLWRTAFGLTPARHLVIDAETAEAWQQTPVPASTPWAEAPGMQVQARLRATGSYQKPGAPPKLRSRARERELLARQLAEEASAARAARRQLVERRAERLSELGELDDGAFRLLLNLLGDALAASSGDDSPVTTTTGDGSLRITLAPLGPETAATLHTAAGVLRGRDYRLEIVDLEEDAWRS